VPRPRTPARRCATTRRRNSLPYGERAPGAQKRTTRTRLVASGASAAPHDGIIDACTTPASTISRHRRRYPARQVHGDHRRLGQRQETLAFDIVFAEGQRRYLESLNAYARQFVQPAARPDVDAIFGIPPTVAIEQRTSRGGRKSTVATLTEIYHFLRLLYVKLGTQHCPTATCRSSRRAGRDRRARPARLSRRAHRPARAAGGRTARAIHRPREMGRGKGYTHLRVDGEFVPTAPWPRLDRFREHTIELPVADVRVRRRTKPAARGLARALEHGKGVVHVLSPARHAGARDGRTTTALARDDARRCSRPEARLPVVRAQLPRARPAAVLVQLQARLVRRLLRHRAQARRVDWDEERAKTGAEDHVLDSWSSGWSSMSRVPRATAAAQSEALAVRYRGRSDRRPDRAADGASSRRFFGAHRARGARSGDRARHRRRARSRLAFSRRSGSATSRSTARRRRSPAAKRSASGSPRSSAPTCAACATSSTSPRSACIRATTASCSTRWKLEAKGNTLIVVEHDEDTIRRAAHVIDLGPGAGKLGGASSPRARPKS
jgi:excinuclease ABC subunit A